MSTTTTPRPASPASINFYNSLATERGLPTASEGMSQRDVSQGIDRMKAMPRPRTQAAPQAPVAEVADGRYALVRVPSIENLPGDSRTVFIKVRTPQDGKWAGFTFVDYEAGEQRIPVKDRTLKAAVLRIISHDPLGASMLYGREVGRCGVCHIKLTDDDSRAMGIGPDCFENMTGRRRVKADAEPYLPGGAAAEAEVQEEDLGNAAEARLAEIETRPENNRPVPMHVLARMGAEQISGMEMNRDTGEFDRPLRRERDRQREEAIRQAEAISKDKRERFAARIPAALAEGVQAWLIRDGIADDEDITDGDRTALYALLDREEARRAVTPQQRQADKARAAAIAAAYAAGDTEKGRALEAEDPGFAARRRAEFGF